jgi:hypothetical protein
MDNADAAQVPAERRSEHAVVGQGVKRAVVSELVVAGGAENEHIRRQHPARVIGYHQHAAGRREGFQAPTSARK